jgi:hypothetical protein
MCVIRRSSCPSLLNECWNVSALVVDRSRGLVGCWLLRDIGGFRGRFRWTSRVFEVWAKSLSLGGRYHAMGISMHFDVGRMQERKTTLAQDTIDTKHDEKLAGPPCLR